MGFMFSTSLPPPNNHSPTYLNLKWFWNLSTNCEYIQNWHIYWFHNILLPIFVTFCNIFVSNFTNNLSSGLTYGKNGMFTISTLQRLKNLPCYLDIIFIIFLLCSPVYSFYVIMFIIFYCCGPHIWFYELFMKIIILQKKNTVFDNSLLIFVI